MKMACLPNMTLIGKFTTLKKSCLCTYKTPRHVELEKCYHIIQAAELTGYPPPHLAPP